MMLKPYITHNTKARCKPTILKPGNERDNGNQVMEEVVTLCVALEILL
jgi:hypothetical protein